MKIEKFYESIRHTANDIEKIDNIDNIAMSIFRKKCDKKFILNNRLSCYLVYLCEKRKINECAKGDFEIIKNSVYMRFEKLNNTIEYLNHIGKKTDTRFLLIKSLNVIPYMPVYDVDLVASNNKFFDVFDRLEKMYYKTDEREENKINYSTENIKYFKLSFHQDITWDGAKEIDIDHKEMWEECIKISPYVYINSPRIEALIRVQECLLERLHFNLIDYLFATTYLDEKHIHLLKKRISWEKYPQSIGLIDLLRSRNGDDKLLFKNISRLISWNTYTFLTGKVPFHE